jgi:hypothetical protein
MKSSNASLIKPGFGCDILHLGQSELDVMSALGRPETRTEKYKGQYFYNYPSRGIEVDFARKGGVIAYLFFFREGVRGNRQANVETEQGIGPGDTKEQVLRLLGEPDENGAPEVLNSGVRFGEWFSYRAGINLQFGEDGRVNMITITSPK